MNHVSHVHTYKTSCSWVGSTASGYESYDRTHRISASGQDLTLSSDAAFRGDPSMLNPEELLVMAASSCQLLAFLAVASRARIDIVSYEDEAVGEMPEEEKPMRLTRILLKPRIVVSSEAEVSEERMLRMVEVAHRECFIANSLRTSVEIEPTLVWNGS